MTLLAVIITSVKFYPKLLSAEDLLFVNSNTIFYMYGFIPVKVNEIVRY